MNYETVPPDLKPGQVTPSILSFLLHWFNFDHCALTGETGCAG